MFFQCLRLLNRRIMLNKDFQELEAGSLIELVEVDGTEFGADILRFHAHPIKPVKNDNGDWHTPSITHEGKEYFAWPYQVSGLSMQSNQAPTPTLTVGNTDNRVTALCLLFEDMLGAKVTITTTTVEYLDTPDQFKRSVWYIEEKSSENNETVTFRLSSPADVGGQKLPSRVMTRYCTWALRGGYRGADCGYTGAAMYDEDDNPTDDPAKDKCAGRFGSCRARFEPLEQPLRFGGFPSVGLIKG